MYFDEREVLSASASMVAPTPRPPAPELLDELELLEDELELLLDEDELELLLDEDELELLEVLELLEELELEDELGLPDDVAPPQAVKAPNVKHNRLALNSASELLPETGFVMLFHLNGWIL